MSLLKNALYLSSEISDNPWIKSINRGLLQLVPLIILGSMALVVNNFPLSGYQTLMASWFGDNWKSFGDVVYNFTFGIMGIALSITIAYSYVAAYTEDKEKYPINPIIASLTAVSSLLLIISTESSGLHSSHAGTTGVFLSIVITILSVKLFLLLHEYLNINFGSFFVEADQVIPQAMFSILPCCMTLVVFTALRFVLAYFGIQDINQVFIDLTKLLFSSIESPSLAAAFFIILSQVFWFFGIHGSNVLFSVSNDIYLKAIDLNVDAIAAGAAAPHILTKPFLDSFALIGGSGSTLCLLIAIFLVARKSNMAKLAKISLVPAIFNINEILVFGLPVVMNLVFLIPFVLAPLVLTLIAYAATAAGLVPVTIAPINWTTPPLLGAWMATDSWRGMALQVLNIAVGTAIYYPFVKAFEMQKEHEIIGAYHRLLDNVLNVNYSRQTHLLSRSDQVGSMAKNLVREIREAIRENGFFLEYQPQVDEKGRVLGVEALLRWNHPRYGRVPPQLVVSLAEEAGMIDELGRWIIDRAGSQLAEWNAQGLSDLRMSINISPMQLRDESLLTALTDTIAGYGLRPEDLELEITETLAFETNQQTIDLINRIKEMGVSIAIDDFGMGHASLYCLRYLNLDRIKIDGSLTKEVENNKSCQDIISSINYLAENMQISVIAEFVETPEQLQLLKELGCRSFQGYHFSCPLPHDQCSTYITRGREDTR
ncbi:MAG: PTS sugar transporter subunit IIC/EAL domain-containing protein [Firmicutes bacterium]|nr:PTS sugar transporter subunit IIC/EAL domain-containing protein [Bacillota bacterium]